MTVRGAVTHAHFDRTRRGTPSHQRGFPYPQTLRPRIGQGSRRFNKFAFYHRISKQNRRKDGIPTGVMMRAVQCRALILPRVRAISSHQQR